MLLRVTLLGVYGLLVTYGAVQIARRDLGCDPVMTPKSPVCSGRVSTTITRAMQTAPDVAYRASRALEAGHRLREDDLQLPDGFPTRLAAHVRPRSAFVGKYLRNPIPRNAELTDAMLSAMFNPALSTQMATDPALATKAAATLGVWLGRSQSQLAGILDVGWTVDLCDDETCVLRRARVLGIDCQTTGDDRCTLVLHVPLADKTNFLNHKRKDKLTVVISEPKPGG